VILPYLPESASSCSIPNQGILYRNKKHSAIGAAAFVLMNATIALVTIRGWTARVVSVVLSRIMRDHEDDLSDRRRAAGRGHTAVQRMDTRTI